MMRVGDVACRSGLRLEAGLPCLSETYLPPQPDRRENSDIRSYHLYFPNNAVIGTRVNVQYLDDMDTPQSPYQLDT